MKGFTTRAALVPGVMISVAALICGCPHSNSVKQATRSLPQEPLDAARIERLVDEAVNVYQTSGREIAYELFRPAVVASFDFPACLEPLVIERNQIRPVMIELMQPGRLGPDQERVAEWCWTFIYDPNAEVIVSHFETADGLPFCGVNVQYGARRRRSVYGLQVPP
jgi:hypothetical protein